MIRDKSGISKVGLALLRTNLASLSPPKRIELQVRGEQQVLVVIGPFDSYESNSFGWGRDDDRPRTLAEAVGTLGWPLPVEDVQKFEPDKGLLIKEW